MNEYENKVEGFIVFTINVGSLSPSKAQMFIIHLKDYLNENKPNSLQEWKTIFIPVRPPQKTKVQIFLCKENGNIQLAKQWVKPLEEIIEKRTLANKNFELEMLNCQVDELNEKIAGLETQLKNYESLFSSQ